MAKGSTRSLVALLTSSSSLFLLVFLRHRTSAKTTQRAAKTEPTTIPIKAPVPRPCFFSSPVVGDSSGTFFERGESFGVVRGLPGGGGVNGGGGGAAPLMKELPPILDRIVELNKSTRNEKKGGITQTLSLDVDRPIKSDQNAWDPFNIRDKADRTIKI